MLMIDRIARAIYTALLGADIGWEQIGDGEKTLYREAAQKALMALRAPTDEMLAEGCRRDLPTDAANIWERMLFRALQG